MITVAHVDELSGDTQLLAGFAHASFQDRADVQLLADFTKDVLFVFALERKTGGSPGDAQSRHLGKHVNEFFGHSVTQVLVVLIRAYVYERQNGDALFRNRCSRLALSRHRVVVAGADGPAVRPYQ